MRTLLILPLLTAFGMFANAQTTAVCMTYDLAGNRTERLTCGAGLTNPGDGATDAFTQQAAGRSNPGDNTAPLKGQIIPNPNDGHFDLALDRPVENGRFEIYGAQGDLLLQQNARGERHTFHLQDVPAGNYYMVLKSEGKVLGQWIIMKN